MNHFLQLSVDYANQRNYLDSLFRVYPTIPEGIRELDSRKWEKVENSFHQQDNQALIESLLKLNLFPIKDSYVAYLKRDKKSINLNPETINRLGGRLYEMGLSKIWEKCSEPKETNRQMGPLFKRWLGRGSLGIQPIGLVIGEAKFLTDFGGHQNAQFADAISTIESPVNTDVIKVAILDGVLYIPGNNKMYKDITQRYNDYNIMSALVLPDFLYQV